MGTIAAASVARGVPSSWFGYRRVEHETVQEYFRRRSPNDKRLRYEIVHPVTEARNPLPCNVHSGEELPDDRGWWGYSFRDVPRRISDETFIATLPDCLITWYRDPSKDNDFFPAILNRDSRALEMREFRFRPLHALTLRQSQPPVRLKNATWFAERVYHNYSHWLTAHLPKLLLLQKRNLLDGVLLPPERTRAMDGSLRLLGMNPEDFHTYDPSRPLFVENLTIIGTDRFRPELLRLIPEALGIVDAAPPDRKVFISRTKAKRRRLINEDQVWPLLERQGFQRVCMEELPFSDQVNLMRETAILAAPHGAGLTNMIFCPEGAQIIEIADLSFPNPNFYALASAMGHDYWLIRAESVGDLHPLEKDLRVDPAAVSEVIRRLTPPPAG
ncbi:glycosyltransferase family 61 protein [Desulfonatronum parangueonense]